MSKSTKLNRRSFLYGQAAIAAVGVCGTAYAFEPSQRLNDTLVKDHRNQARWETATANQFSEFVKQPFTAYAKDGSLHHLTLVDVKAGNSGPARPKDLPRSESVLLVFKSDFAADLAAQGHQSVTVWHSTLGEFEVLLGAVPRRSGSYDIEVVLN